MMQVATLMLTRHVQWRMAQRNLSARDIAFICTHGIHIHGAGAVSYFFGQRQLRKLDRTTARAYAHLEGVIVLCCPHCRCVITAYHNHNGLKQQRHKTKYNTDKYTCRYCERDSDIPLSGIPRSSSNDALDNIGD